MSLVSDEKFIPKYTGDNIYYNELPTNREKSNSQYLITIKELLDVDNLESAALSSFCLDFDFVRSLIPMEKRMIPLTLIKHWSKGQGEDDEKQGRTLVQIGKSPVCICHPYLLPAFSTMHAKLMLLEFPKFLRVVVSSANLTTFDWDCYTQCIWVQDFPRLKKDQKVTSNSFQKDLCEFWSHLTCKLPHEWLKRYDFSEAKVDLVPSVPGYHTGKAKTQYGHMCIRNLIKNNITAQQAQVLKDKDLYFQMSSIGTLGTKWLSEFAKSANVDYVPVLPAKQKKLTASETSSSSCVNQLKIVFPSVETVKSSTLGLRAGGMIHLKLNAYSGKEFPTHALCDYQSNLKSQEGNLAHAKIMVHKSDPTLANGRVGWVYAGSHNFSMAAWGRLQKDETQLQISNYELGVFFKNLPPNFQLPFKTPAKSYGKNDKPFILDEVNK
ncbi:tyrosyl-DNA phosphodiesterase [Acrasis kona]|uniref:Tyrosyl-DNA phosphodiesterase n=1 Tax=Acrasis kona TaxID=1008807 RepID=A0AAW2Z6X3_9EUKA